MNVVTLVRLPEYKVELTVRDDSVNRLDLLSFHMVGDIALRDTSEQDALTRKWTEIRGRYQEQA